VDALNEWVDRGGQLKFTVSVLDEYGEFVRDADVEIAVPNSGAIKLERGAGNVYTGIYAVPWNAPAGRQEFEIKALKKTEYSVQQGRANFTIEIRPAQISIELLEPKGQEFQAGDEIHIRARLAYPSGEPVAEPVINASVNKEKIVLMAEGSGMYSVSYLVKPEDSGRVVLSVAVEDGYANSGAQEYDFYVSGTSWVYWVKAFPLVAGLVFFAAIISIVLTYLIRHRRRSLSSLRKRERELGALRADCQNRYYKLNVIDRETYNEMRSKYDTELEVVKEAIKALEKKKARKEAKKENGTKGEKAGKGEKK